MVKHNDLRGALDFIKQGYSKSGDSFSFTVSDIADAMNLSETKARNVVSTINIRARFWRGHFPAAADGFTVNAPVIERLQGWFE
ncbi:hypothetical protein [Pseudodesulfovibrio indicus]|uniref:hypothetical protein n=1 Tax=Pseudodesulfovibrio indicus TaxID=1716143 RepID=UPI0029309B5C|nr:hypothetical protein [Pseudodesulfovibrio indicus]